MRIFDEWRSWDDAHDALSGQLPAEGLERLATAYAFAAYRHATQTRPAGEPYTHHLLEVVEILSTALDVTDPDLLTATLLHDVVEDTPTSLAEVEQRFGPRVAETVGHVTMSSIAPDDDRAGARHRYLSGLRDLPADALLLKLADRYSNVQRLHTHPPASEATLVLRRDLPLPRASRDGRSPARRPLHGVATHLPAPRRPSAHRRLDGVNLIRPPDRAHLIVDPLS